MRRGPWVAVGMLVSALVVPHPAWAESRPLKQLPKDLARWSTMWIAIPQQMIDVGLDYGPVAAVTWGPAKGTAKMVEDTTQDMWDAMKPEPHPGQRRHDEGTKAAIFRYTF